MSVRKTVTRDIDRRSPERQAEVKVRMSRTQRETLHRIAAARGETVAGLLLLAIDALRQPPPLTAHYDPAAKDNRP